jgi:hypothetical protein
VVEQRRRGVHATARHVKRFVRERKVVGLKCLDVEERTRVGQRRGRREQLQLPRQRHHGARVPLVRAGRAAEALHVGERSGKRGAGGNTAATTAAAATAAATAAAATAAAATAAAATAAAIALLARRAVAVEARREQQRHPLLHGHRGAL